MNISVCLDQLEELTVRSPEFPDHWYNFALVLDHLERHSDALTVMERALELNPQYLAAGVSRCFLLGETGKAAEGFRSFRQLYARSADDFDTVFALGSFCMRHGWKDAGVAQLKRAELARPNLPYVLLATAAALEELGQNEAARERIERARSILDTLEIPALNWSQVQAGAQPPVQRKWKNPCSTQVHVLLANFRSAAGEMEKAGEELRLANSSLPGHAGLMAHMGGLLHTRDRLDEAEQWFSVATRLDPTCNEAYFQQSFVLAEKQKWGPAVAALRAAVQLRPLFPDYHYHLGTLLMEVEKVDEAVEEFQRVLTLNPFYGHATVQLASAHLRKNAAGEALEVLARGSCADWPEALVLSTAAHLMSGRRIEARCVLEKALASGPTCSEAESVLCCIEDGETGTTPNTAPAAPRLPPRGELDAK
jgi:tetratricopeptide (TPR) repeat protein